MNDKVMTYEEAKKAYASVGLNLKAKTVAKVLAPVATKLAATMILTGVSLAASEVADSMLSEDDRQNSTRDYAAAGALGALSVVSGVGGVICGVATVIDTAMVPGEYRNEIENQIGDPKADTPESSLKSV